MPTASNDVISKYTGESGSNRESGSDKEFESGKESGSRRTRLKKRRTVYTHNQIYRLKHAFGLKPYLTSMERASLSSSLGISEIQVKVWFQNQRNKCKRELLMPLSTDHPNQHLPTAGQGFELPMAFPRHVQQNRPMPVFPSSINNTTTRQSSQTTLSEEDTCM